MSAVDDLLLYYTNLLASIYRDKPKASAQVALFVKEIVSDGLPLQFGSAFDLETAVGVQLDLIGKYVGIPRDVGTVDFRPYFGMVDSATYPSGEQNLNGFISSVDLSVNPTGVWFRDEMTGLSSSQLSDFSYRQLIKIKIMTNSNFNTVSDIQNEIATFFQGQLQLRDNRDMTMDYYYGSDFQLPTTVLQKNLPRPMGVGITLHPAIAFNVSVDGVAAYTSQTPHPVVDFVDSSFHSFTITNVTDEPFTVTEIEMDDPGFVVSSISPTLPATLDRGDSLTYTVSYTT